MARSAAAVSACRRAAAKSNNPMRASCNVQSNDHMLNAPKRARAKRRHVQHVCTVSIQRSRYALPWHALVCNGLRSCSGRGPSGWYVVHVGMHLGSVHRPQAGLHYAVHVAAAGGGVMLQQLHELLRVDCLGKAASLRTWYVLVDEAGCTVIVATFVHVNKSRQQKKNNRQALHNTC
jgi:hypothetical protein